jgi:pimeloyl-ACP methyl ester carboxylesterase
MKIVIKNNFNEKLVGVLNKHGSKELALIIHGFKGNKDNIIFKNIQSTLDKLKIDSLRFDFSGSGESDGKYSESTITKQAWEIDLIIKKMKYKKIILIAHSMGCSCSILASSINTKIKAMILISPLVFPYITFKDSLIKYSPFVFLSKFNPKKIELLNKSKKLRHAKNKISELIDEEVIGNEMFEEFKKMDLLCIAKNLIIPCMIIHGKNDELIPVSHAEYLNYSIKNRQLFG